ncbi:cell wall anchor protein [Jejudonia soesokkakensis]|uniref:Cell wall anchor protein n=1 Tax=Jejudonia soesokkakensis TaxID=1323432 RepID=A0ABW2MRZ4_9FLAO
MKFYYFLGCFLFSLTSSIAQVGIGTTDPDPSAVLDIESTTGGLLTPRMSTADILLISNPAEGLLVFDTDKDIFCFYSGGNWNPVESSEKRDNYRLVKSTADLSDELIAGGGSKYVLSSNFLYEINGNITIDYPIELNGAYIEGVDVGSDVLTNGSSGALFTGTTGGSLRNMSVNGNGKQVFNINGGGTANIVVNSTIFYGASSLGTANNVNAFFVRSSSYASNIDGFSITNAVNVIFGGPFWASSNQGTFLTLNGAITNVEITGGSVAVDSGETGIDVSSDPAVTKGVIFNTNFTGNGTLVDGYSATNTYAGYSFSNNWFVNTPGIPLETDFVANGNISLNAAVGVGYVTDFITIGSGVPAKLGGVTTNNNLFRFIASGNNRIVYDGEKTRYFNISASISAQGSAGAYYIFYIAKGNSGSATATVLTDTKVYRLFSSATDIGAVSVLGSVQLAPGDFIEIWAERYVGAGTLNVVSMNLIAN